jgi:4-oxalocrotonate tautomerase
MPELHVFIEQGRTLEEKRKLVRELTDVFVRNLDVAPEAVMIQIIEGSKSLSRKRRWSTQRSTGNSLH